MPYRAGQISAVQIPCCIAPGKYRAMQIPCRIAPDEYRAVQMPCRIAPDKYRSADDLPYCTDKHRAVQMPCRIVPDEHRAEPILCRQYHIGCGKGRWAEHAPKAPIRERRGSRFPLHDKRTDTLCPGASLKSRKRCYAGWLRDTHLRMQSGMSRSRQQSRYAVPVRMPGSPFFRCSRN